MIKNTETMSIRQLRTFIAIAEHGTFAAAAEAMALTQSAVSVQVKNIEDEMGKELFDRSKRPPVLNEAGRALVPHARKLISEYDALRDHISDDSAYEGAFRLGSVGSLLTGFIPSVLITLKERYPRLHIELASGFTSELVTLVDRGALDAAIVSDLKDPPAGLNWMPFLREPLVLIAPPDAPDLTAQQLVETYPFIRYVPETSVGKVIDAAIRAAKLKPREQMRLDWIEAIEAMVSAGLGVSVVPAREHQRSHRPPVKRVAFGKSVRYRTLGLVQRAGDETNGFSTPLFETLKSASP